MNCDAFIKSLPPHTVALIAPLHAIAAEHGCRCRVDENAYGVNLIYSVRSFKISLRDGSVSFYGEFDPRAFYRLFGETVNDKVNELLFKGVEACSLCINDKCTTFLMAENRTIEWNGSTKKLCGPYRHNLTADVTPDNIGACLAAARMIFEYTLPHMHTDIFYKNEVDYTVAEKDAFYLIGYMARHNSLSKADDELVRSVLSDKTRRTALDNLSPVRGRYIGAVDKFIDGNTYEFIFGIMTRVKPAVLPADTVCRRINGGEWAVYNSSAGDYKSIWRHFSANFYNTEGKGYDPGRIPFEYYDESGRIFDVHIPVSPDCSADSSKSVRVLRIPVMRLAGFSWYNEADHPQAENYDFDVKKRLTDAFPNADRIIGISTHAFLGKPMRHGCFYIYDDLEPVPGSVNTYEFNGGAWIVESWHHFNGGICDYPFDRPMNFKTKTDDMHHPGPWIDIDYLGARGGYVELGNPIQLKGTRSFEPVQLPPQRIIGKPEAPPLSVVTDREIKAFYSMPENKEQGSYVIGYTVTVPEGKGMYFDRPLVKGVFAEDDTPVPEGLWEFYLDGGRYIHITEDIPNGEPGWEIEYLADALKSAGYTADESRQFIIKQNAYGKSYEWFVPYIL
ncbi:MAG: GyrI-like domain-containing protein [Eubacteriales bacterium]|nr:GyrI-like domain-containing protein [Eubacteriales bacterium]